MKTITSFFCAAMVIVLIDLVFSQDKTTQNEWPFFPLKIGNFWRYEITINGGVYGYDRETIVDSLMIEGEWFRKKRIQYYTGGELFTYFKQKDSTFITERFGIGQYSPFRRVYKINAQNGEKWLVEISPDDSSRKVWGQLDSTAYLKIFGVSRATKHYRFYQEYEGTLQWTKFIILAYGLGLIQIRGGDGGIDFDDVDLVGAIINGITYGNPVSVDDRTVYTPGPQLFIINYPNPFATATKIEVNFGGLVSKEPLQIAVYNLNGQKIRTIHNGVLSMNQRFLATWNGHNDLDQRVSDGLYFVQVRIGRLVQSKQTLLLQ